MAGAAVGFGSTFREYGDHDGEFRESRYCLRKVMRPSSCKNIGYGLLNAELFSTVRKSKGIPDAGHNAKYVA